MAGVALAPIHCNTCHALIDHTSLVWSNPNIDYDMCTVCYIWNQELAHSNNLVLVTYQTRSEQALAAGLGANPPANNIQVAPPLGGYAPFVLQPPTDPVWLLPEHNPQNKRKHYKCWDTNDAIHMECVCPGDHDIFLRLMQKYKRMEEVKPEEAEARGLKIPRGLHE